MPAPHDPARRASPTPSTRGEVTEADIDALRHPHGGHAAPLPRRRCDAPAPDAGGRWPAPRTGPWPARRPPRRSCCSATSPSTATPLLPARRRVAAPRRGARPLAAVRNLGDGGSSDVWAPDGRHPPRRAAGRPARRRRRHATVDRRRADAAPAPTSPSSSSATPAPTRASSSATAGTAHLARAAARARRPRRGGRLRGPRRRRGRPAAGADGRRRRATRSASPPAATARRCALHDGRRGAHRRASPPPTPAPSWPSSPAAPCVMERVAPRRARHRAGSGTRAWRAATRLADVLLGARRRHAAGCPFSVPTDEAHLPAVRPRRRRRHLRRLARLLAPRPRPPRGRPTRSASGSRTRPGRSGPTDARRRRRRRSSCGPRSRNTGDRDGTDVVQVYAGRPADTTRPARRLVAFARVEVAGRRRASRSSCAIPWSRLAVRDPRRARVGGARPAPTCSPSAATAPTSTPSTSCRPA